MSNRDSESSWGCLWGVGRTRMIGLGSPESLRESENFGLGRRGGERRRKRGENEKRPRVMLDRRALTGSREFSLF